MCFAAAFSGVSQAGEWELAWSDEFDYEGPKGTAADDGKPQP